MRRIFGGTHPVYGGEANPTDSTASRQGVTDLPIFAQGTISSMLGREDATYHFSRTETGYSAKNARHRLQAEMRTNGVLVRKGAFQWCVSLQGYGYQEPLRKLSAVSPQADANRIEYRYGELTEWYVNGPRGLQQGFTIQQAPGERTSAPLTLRLAISGNVTMRGAGDALILTGPAGQTVFYYGGLSVFDARGKSLRAWLEVRGEALLVRVDDARAEYPVVIDPFIETVKLTASDGHAQDLFGTSVATSGETIVVGAASHHITPDRKQGTVYVFVKPASGWEDMRESAKLTVSDAADGDAFGCSVAISGETIVVGARGDHVGPNRNQGAAYVFVRPASGWEDMTETVKLTASDGGTEDEFGCSVAVSEETIVVGARGAKTGSNQGQGAAYVFVKDKPGATFTAESARLTASDGAAFDGFGVSVAICGETIVVGAPFDDIGSQDGQGSAYVFVQPDSGWKRATETAKLTAFDGDAGDFFGDSVAIRVETIVVGAPSDEIGSHDGQGSAYVFVKPELGWVTTTDSGKLTAFDGAAYDQFGSQVAISGEMIVVGSPFGSVNSQEAQGSAYVFVNHTARQWADTMEALKFTSFDGAGADWFGYSVAVNGETIVVGAGWHDIEPHGDQGSAYVFVYDPRQLQKGVSECRKQVDPGQAAEDIRALALCGCGGEPTSCTPAPAASSQPASS